MTESSQTHTYNVGVVGATGFAGIELSALLHAHPQFNLVAVASSQSAGASLGSYYPGIAQDLAQKTLISLEEFTEANLDLAFLAVPHTTAFDLVHDLSEKGVRVVDLSADFRLKDTSAYETYYVVTHPYPSLIEDAVYGLTEWKRAHIQNAQIVANPGCYPTAVALACLPACADGLADLSATIVASAVSGYSGAGKKACELHNYSVQDESLKPYKALTHQHLPEITQTLSFASNAPISLAFTPHIASYKRGILASCFIPLKETTTLELVKRAYTEAYAAEPFIELLPWGEVPDVANVRGTNNAQLGLSYDEHTSTLYVACAIDNLMKGAASQAVQNANCMFGLEETMGLKIHSEVI